METIAFYAGQFGLLLAGGCSIGILQVQAKNPNRPNWYYFAVVWCIAVASVLLASEPYVYSRDIRLVEVEYWFRAAFGLERAIVLINYWQQRAGHFDRLPPTTLSRINISIGIVTGLILTFVFGTAGFNYYTSDTATIARRQAQTQRVAVANGAKVDSVQAVVLSLKERAVRDSVDNARLRGQLAQATAEIAQLKGLIGNLSRAVRSLSLSVERTRRTISTPAPLAPKTGDASLLDTDKVQPTAPPKRGRKRYSLLDRVPGVETGEVRRELADN